MHKFWKLIKSKKLEILTVNFLHFTSYFAHFTSKK